MDAELQALVEEVFTEPTLEGLDDLIGELRSRRRDPAVAVVIDDLLDSRFALVNAGGSASAA
jgi:hypothetical protein